MLVRQWQLGRLPGYRPTWADLHLAGAMDRADQKYQSRLAAAGQKMIVIRR